MLLAAVMYAPGHGVETDMLLADVARAMQRRGLHLAGSIQATAAQRDGCRCDMTLEDLATGHRIDTFEDRGPLARGCRLNAQALEEAVGLARASLTPGIDLVIINRFGKREAEGRGFRPVIEAAVDMAIPVLIAVNTAQSEAWYQFTGSEAASLTPTRGKIAAWCDAAMRVRQSSAHQLPHLVDSAADAGRNIGTRQTDSDARPHAGLDVSLDGRAR